MQCAFCTTMKGCCCNTNSFHEVHSLCYCRHEDLKSMLDSSKDGQKREAMKLIIGVSIIPYALLISEAYRNEERTIDLRGRGRKVPI